MKGHVSTSEMLEAHLRCHPKDEERWLVYADWLTDQGDERGSLLLWEHQHTQAGLTSEAREQLKYQIDALTAEYQDKWLDGWSIPEKTTLYWRGGFICGARFEDPCARTAIEALVAHRTARFLTQLSLAWSGIGDMELFALVRSGSLRAILDLNLSRAEIGDEGVRAVSTLDTLAALHLGGNYISSGGARILASSDRLRTLTTLDLRHNRIDNEGALALATSEHLRGLVTLKIRHNRIDNGGLSLLQGSEHLRSCTIDG